MILKKIITKTKLLIKESEHLKILQPTGVEKQLSNSESLIQVKTHNNLNFLKITNLSKTMLISIFFFIYLIEKFIKIINLGKNKNLLPLPNKKKNNP